MVQQTFIMKWKLAFSTDQVFDLVYLRVFAFVAQFFYRSQNLEFILGLAFSLRNKLKGSEFWIENISLIERYLRNKPDCQISSDLVIRQIQPFLGLFIFLFRFDSEKSYKSLRVSEFRKYSHFNWLLLLCWQFFFVVNVAEGIKKLLRIFFIKWYSNYFLFVLTIGWLDITGELKYTFAFFFTIDKLS